MTYITNTYATNILIHVRIPPEIQTQLIYITCSIYKIFYKLFCKFYKLDILQILYIKTNKT